MATGSDVVAQLLIRFPSRHAWYFEANRRRAKPSSFSSLTRRTFASQSLDECLADLGAAAEHDDALRIAEGVPHATSTAAGASPTRRERSD